MENEIISVREIVEVEVKRREEPQEFQVTNKQAEYWDNLLQKTWKAMAKPRKIKQWTLYGRVT